MPKKKKTYVVRYDYKATQTYLVENCSSKKEAMQKAWDNHDDAEALGFETTIVYKSTLRARVDGAPEGDDN